MKKLFAIIGIAALLAMITPSARAVNGDPGYSPATLSLSAIQTTNNAIGQLPSAFTGSTNWPAGAGPTVATMKYQNIALEDDMIVPTNSLGATNTYTFARSISGGNGGTGGYDLTPADEYVWVHAYTQSAGIIPTNHVVTTNIVIGGYGYLRLVSYAVTTGTNQSTLWYSQKISCP